MTETTPDSYRATGQCACGGVRYRVTGSLRPVNDCHCARCRRITGHFMAATACADDELLFESDGSLQWYTPDEEPAVHYGFCNRCGGSLFWNSDERPEAISICAGTVDPPTNLQTEGALFVADASDYHVLDDSVQTFAYDRPHDA